MIGYAIARLAALVLLALTSAPALAAEDIRIGDVPLPADAAPTDPGAWPFSGVWAGSWGGQINHVFIVEAVRADGQAEVIYAIGDNGAGAGRWIRRQARVDGDTLRLIGEGFGASYRISPTGRLRGVFGDGFGYSVLERRDFAAMRAAPDVDWWSIGRAEMIETALREDDAPVRLNTVMYTPPGDGPFPLALVHHGSTGDGTDPAIADIVWTNDWFADLLNARGWLVAFPQRRGRGGSDGVYDEGFGTIRSAGYSAMAAYSLPGADRALEDAEAALAALRARPDVAGDRLLLGGLSRGGVVAILQAGARPSEVEGVVNFVGGWVSESWGDAEINPILFARGGAFGGPVLSIYGEDDPFYSIGHSRRNLAALSDAGAESRLHVVRVRGERAGHWAMAVPDLWRDALETYLDDVAP